MSLLPVVRKIVENELQLEGAVVASARYEENVYEAAAYLPGMIVRVYDYSHDLAAGREAVEHLRKRRLHHGDFFLEERHLHWYSFRV